MDTPGKFLKAEREKKERSLKELAELLKLKVAYLKAIEEEDYLSIPGEIFIKGYIRVYADALGLDSNYILNLYKQQIAKVTQTDERPVVTKNKIFTYKPILIIASAFFLIVTFLVVFTTREEEKSVTKSLRLVPERAEEEAVESQVLIEKEQEKFSLEIAVTELTWISVSVDSNRPIVRFLKPGEVVKWRALKKFSINIGNAGAAKLTFNGKELGNLGPYGKVVKLVLPENKNTQKSDG